MSKQTQFEKVKILGVEVDALTMTEAIDYLCDRARPDQPSGYAIKPYVEFLDQAYGNRRLQSLLGQAELSLADGVALLWAAAFLYAGPRTFGRFCLTLAQIVLAPKELIWPLPERTAGINFTWELLDEAARRGLKLYLIGQPKTAAITDTAAALQQHWPNLQIVGTLSGRDPASKLGAVSDAWLADCAAQVSAARPDLVLVGMGFPLQETVCAYLTEHASHGIFIGEGGSFDYERFGGHQPKAPAGWQRIGLEWLWRLLREPSRLWRQLAIPRFIWRVWRSR